MSKTVKLYGDGRVQLEDEKYPTVEEADKILIDAGYDPEQVKTRGLEFVKMLFENLELHEKLREYDVAFNMLLGLVPVDMTVDLTNPKLMAQHILEGVEKHG